MKKYWRYIKCTFLCRYNKDIKIGKNTKIKWIEYAIKKDSGNRLVLENSSISHCSFSINGLNNTIIVDENAKIGNCSFSVIGDNNEIHISGTTGSMTIFLRGKECRVQTGKQTSIGGCNMVCMGENSSIGIGDDCMFSGDIEIWNTDSHLITDLEGNFLSLPKPIVIGNHVWLGKASKILKNVTIGNNAIIGMGSVVTKNVPEHSIAAGNPARVIKQGIDWRKNT